ncbi:TetR family transcriptional regulator [Streptomyces sp. 150FB]|uniref:TetR/AcrR family transcriptional regulator n=1 Tax=Streptomyces sp. 150FB TaxID=1576605 RepID=UPI00058969A0|nr:TetR/AcrR family transcriptional regulator [Streptomyces sp. 150FB]KIF76738.1 TetR family transcriptional regulator [Streptomyces sp. 150FB]
MSEGLRERKKRQTRQYISDVATGMFLERGFEAVTIAEIAEAADISVNTVYNYFPAKEDLFLDRASGLTGRLSRFVRGREPGESAAEAVFAGLYELIEAVSPTTGLVEGYDLFMKVVHDSHTLKSRLLYLQQEIVDDLARTLREETGAGDDEMLPTLVAGQLAWANGTVMGWIGGRMAAGGVPAEVSREALGLLGEVEELLSEKVRKYAVREA